MLESRRNWRVSRRGISTMSRGFLSGSKRKNRTSTTFECKGLHLCKGEYLSERKVITSRICYLSQVNIALESKHAKATLNYRRSLTFQPSLEWIQNNVTIECFQNANHSRTITYSPVRVFFGVAVLARIDMWSTKSGQNLTVRNSTTNWSARLSFSLSLPLSLEFMLPIPQCGTYNSYHSSRVSN